VRPCGQRRGRRPSWRPDEASGGLRPDQKATEAAGNGDRCRSRGPAPRELVDTDAPRPVVGAKVKERSRSTPRPPFRRYRNEDPGDPSAISRHRGENLPAWADSRPASGIATTSRLPVALERGTRLPPAPDLIPLEGPRAIAVGGPSVCGRLRRTRQGTGPETASAGQRTPDTATAARSSSRRRRDTVAASLAAPLAPGEPAHRGDPRHALVGGRLAHGEGGARLGARRARPAAAKRVVHP
jgi:hypothetical protein